ncbi:TPA: hypothetical protein HA265_01750 [Candidatus Woesearchaeota archaeon]|nr:hypothetical protein [Candidatus Woesearchaeota archaeon]
MKRKIIKQGVGGNTIFLPVKWVRENNLGPGDDVDIIEDGNSLTISGQAHKQKTKDAKIETDNINLIRSLIASWYKTGYTEIRLRFKQVPDMQQVNRIINTFTGLEVVQQESNSLTIRSFLSTPPEEIESLIIKMFQITRLITQTINESWEKTDLNTINSAKTNLLRLRDHCLRAIRIHKYAGETSFDLHEYVTTLEKISAEYHALATNIKEHKIKRTPMLSESIGLIDEAYKTHLKKDFNSANSLWLKIGKMKRDKRLSSEKDKWAAMHLYRQVNLFRQLTSRQLNLCSQIAGQ